MWSYNSEVGPALYIYRRLTRIYPLHLLCLAVSIAAYAATGITFGGYIGTAWGTVANLLLIHAWIPGHPHVRQAWNGVSWTLSIEFFFYLTVPYLFPRIVRTLPSRLFVVIGATWIVFLGTVLIAQSRNWSAFLDFCMYHPVPRMLEFIAGAAGAQAVKSGWKYRSRAISALLMVTPVLIYCMAVPESLRCPPLMTLLLIPGAILVIVATANVDIAQIRTWTTTPLLIFLGDSSYALYMTHAILLRLFMICLFLITTPAQISINKGELCTISFVVLAVCLSVVVHERIEVPIRYRLIRAINVAPINHK
jgi:peptidoglycan/LPS O-acetylase OafA/YrhL